MESSSSRWVADTLKQEGAHAMTLDKLHHVLFRVGLNLERDNFIREGQEDQYCTEPNLYMQQRL